MYVTAEETYKNITEEHVMHILRDVTEETFSSVVAKIKCLIECRINTVNK